MLTLPLLALAVAVTLVAGYRFVGRAVAARLGLDDARTTPAHACRDGVDFEPTPPSYLLGQHFSAIAAAGPIVGPILACQQFGWLPCVLWIALGCVLIGAVHDLTALVASVRHGAKTVAEVVRQHLSPRAWAAFLAFIWLALLYVIVAFTDVTAGSFLGRIEELEGVKVGFERGGAVALASIAYLTLAVVMGLVQRLLRPPLWLVTAVFVPLAFGTVWLGSAGSTWLALSGPSAKLVWGVSILGYCFVASLLPVWTLMQPRGYLGGFMLYVVLIVGVIGVLFGGFATQQPGFAGFVQRTPEGAATPTGWLFPFLFVTIACGACSGFHGLVCSGTTSKQIDRESHCGTVGYGGMLLEGFVALVALSTVMIVAPAAAAGKPPGAIYGAGIGEYLCVILGSREHLLLATVFGTMAFSTFVFDTLDVATRLGRHIVQELLGKPGAAWGAAATAATVGVPLLFVLTADPDAKRPAYMAYWTLFGASNQLLAALTLLAVSVWLKRTGRPAWFTFLPCLFVMAATATALAKIAVDGLSGGAGFAALANAGVALVLLGLTALLVVEAVLAIRRPRVAEVDEACADPAPPAPAV